MATNYKRFLRNFVNNIQLFQNLMWKTLPHNTTHQVCFYSCWQERGNERQYAAILNKMHQIIKFPDFRRRKIRVHSQTDHSSHLNIIVTAQFLSSCCISQSEKTDPPLQRISIEPIKILGEYSPLRWNKTEEECETTKILG